MVKLVDTPASGAGDRKVVEVQVLFWAPNLKKTGLSRFFFGFDYLRQNFAIFLGLTSGEGG